MKQFRILFVMSLVVFVATQLVAQPLTNNLLFYIPINTGYNDYSGNAYHATSTGTLVANRNGVPGSACQLSLGQTVSWPNLLALHPELPISVSFYVKFNSFGANAFCNDCTPYQYSGMWLGTTGTGTIHLNYGDGGTTSPGFRRSKSSQQGLVLGQWHHVVGVIRSASDMNIYIDCVDAGGTYSGSGSTMYYYGNFPQSGPSSGASIPGGFGYFDGYIDEIAMWDRALTAGDVAKLCKGGLDNLVVASTEPMDQIISVSPNPAINTILVEWSNIESPVKSIRSFDVLGRTIYATETDDNGKLIIDASNFSRGTLFIKLEFENGKHTIRKIVLH